MGTLHYLNRKRLENVLRSSAAVIVVHLQCEGVTVPDYCYRGVPFTVLNVGPQLKPAMNLRFEEDALRATLTKGATLSNPGVAFEATVPWCSILEVHTLDRPPGGGQPGGGEFVQVKAA